MSKGFYMIRKKGTVDKYFAGTYGRPRWVEFKKAKVNMKKYEV